MWAFEQGSRLHERLRYTHGDIFETFPLPVGLFEAPTSPLSVLGEELFATRGEVMRAEQKGMTCFYNDFHDPEFRRQEFGRCRDIQASLNEAVLEAYDLDKIDLELGFNEVGYLPQGKNTRFTMSEKARRKILDELREMNKSRYLVQEESKASARRKPRQNSRESKRNLASSDQSLLNLDTSAKTRHGSGDANGAAEKIITQLKARRSWLSKSDILAYVDIPDGQWNAAINDLMACGTVERQGEHRSTRYRISESV